MKRMPCIDFSTGSLGQGVAIGLGMAMALQAEGGQVWVVLGDGECQEGMVWESAMLAARLGVCNLHVLVDANGQQECGWAHAPLLEQAPIPMDVQKWQAFGWQAESADGHDHNALARWVSLAQQQAIPARPRVLLARTQKALPACGDRMSTQRHHHTQLSDSEFRALLRHYEPTPSTCN